LDNAALTEPKCCFDSHNLRLQIHGQYRRRSISSNSPSQLEGSLSISPLPSHNFWLAAFNVSLPRTMDQGNRLGALPPELLLGLVSNLPAKDICSVRCLGKGYKSFIATHQTAILEPLIAIQQKRIRAGHKAIRDIGNLAFAKPCITS
jgi:hypothetical protein